MKRNFGAKMISLVLVLMLAVSLAACGSGSKYAGTYKLESIEQAGISMNVDEFIKQMSELAGQDVEFDMTLTLKDDGSMKLSANAMGEKEDLDGSWEEDGNNLKITIDGESQEATYKDGKISMEAQGMKVVFAK